MSKTTWVISDTHFNHAAILGFKDYAGKAPRPDFDNVDQMNECMFDNWNDTVGADDTVIHLGDVLLGENKVDWLEANFAQLPGKKRLVLGNHDNVKFLAPFFKDIQLWINDFSGLILTHTPLHPDTMYERHRWGTGPLLNIHGHIHSNPSPDGPYRCVCVEQTDYAPVNIEELITP